MDARPPTLDLSLFRPGQRLAVAVSGGADSVALLRRLIEERQALGIVLSVAHVDHGIRGAESDADAAFVTELAAAHDLSLFIRKVDVPAECGSQRESLEEAARRLRYAFFEELIGQGDVDAVATAHTQDDQAETVLLKLLRGAWTEGLSGIHPVLKTGRGSILRPFLQATRASIENWLRSLHQPWREDASNLDPAHTRNRIRHELLPRLSEFNPEIARQLSRMAAISADEERYWQGELERLLPSLLLPGKPVRGGGRSSSTLPDNAAVAIELERLKQLPPALARRVLRAAAGKVGVRLGFEHTERLLALGDPNWSVEGKAGDRETGDRNTGGGKNEGGSKIMLPGGVIAERTLRELRLSRGSLGGSSTGAADGPERKLPEYPFPIPGEVSAPEFGIVLRAELARSSTGQEAAGQERAGHKCPATLRNWKPGDRVTLRHSRSPKKVSEILDRLRVRSAERKHWPVVETEGRIVWMMGVDVDAPEFVFVSQSPQSRD